MKNALAVLLTIAFMTSIALLSCNSDDLMTNVLSEKEELVETPKLSNEEIKRVIDRGVEWLKTQQEITGHFNYEYMPFFDKYVDDDNVVRQAGAFYFLSEAYKADKENQYELQKNLTRSLTYFKSNSIEEDDFICIKNDSMRCSTGGTSLVMLGLINLVEKSPMLLEKYNDRLQGYKNYLLAMKKEEGGFNAYYYPDGTISDEETPFANGEAFLALTRYNLYDYSSEVKKVLDDSFEYFEKKYTANWDGSFYLWGMAAMKDLYKMDPKPEYYTFVKNYTDWKIALYKNRRESNRNKCAYIEGIVSAYSVLEPKLTNEEKAYYLEEIDFWLLKSTELQVKPTDKLMVSLNGGEPQQIRVANKDKSVGGFLTAPTEPVQRIDYTQHCLSSYLQDYVDINGQKL